VPHPREKPVSTAWPKLKLGEVLKPLWREETIDTTRKYPLLGAHWYAKGLYVKDIKQGTHIRATRLFRVEDGDFVYNRLFAWKGSFALATREVHGCYVSNEFPCFTVDRARLSPSYLLWYFSREDSWNEALGLSFGATPTSRNRLKDAQLLGMLLPLPPLAEQQRIVARIEELAAKIAEARSLREQAIAGAEAFVTNVHIKLAGKRKRKLRDVVKLDEDQVRVEPNSSYTQVGVKSFGFGLFAKTAVSGADTTYKVFNRLYEGALVLSQVKGWEGAVAICPPDLADRFVSPEYRTFQCIESEARPAYLASLVRTEWFWRQLSQATRGVGARRERTRPEQFLSIEMLMPEVNQQAEGERLFTRVDALRTLQTQTVAELEALLPSILDKAFSRDL
jgi:type I restriction enzyme, S subunit